MKTVFLSMQENNIPNEKISKDVIYCMRIDVPTSCTSKNIIHLPDSFISPVCQALFALADSDTSIPVIITTRHINFDITCSEYVLSGLASEDEGWLYFPSIEKFLICAKNALRCHNPLHNMVKLVDCWNQAILHGLVEV